MGRRVYNRLEFESQYIDSFPLKKKKGFLPTLDFSLIIPPPKELLSKKDLTSCMNIGLYYMKNEALKKVKRGEHATQNNLLIIDYESVFKKLYGSKSDLSCMDGFVFDGSETECIEKTQAAYDYYVENGYLFLEEWAEDKWGTPGNAKSVEVKQYKKNTYIYFITEETAPTALIEGLTEKFPFLSGYTVVTTDGLDRIENISRVSISGTKDTWRVRSFTGKDRDSAEYQRVSSAFASVFNYLKK